MPKTDQFIRTRLEPQAATSDSDKLAVSGTLQCDRSSTVQRDCTVRSIVSRLFNAAAFKVRHHPVFPIHCVRKDNDLGTVSCCKVWRIE